MNRICSICGVAAAILSGSVATVASGDLIELTVSGNIIGSTQPTFPAGQLLTVTLRYESTGSPQSIQNQQAFYADHLTYLRVISGSYDSTATGAFAFGQINKYDNFAGGDGISFQAASHPAYYQFSVASAVSLAPASGETFQNMYVNLGSSSGAVWNDYALPASLNFNDFDQTRNASFGFSGNSFFAGITSAVATNLSQVPEPGTAVLLILGAMAMPIMSRRGRAK